MLKPIGLNAHVDAAEVFLSMNGSEKGGDAVNGAGEFIALLLLPAMIAVQVAGNLATITIPPSRH